VRTTLLEKGFAGMTRTVSARDRLNNRIFKAVHARNLIYNTCWEDPALDRVALAFQPNDRVLVITSAGCNALDYLLTGVREVNAVDMNPIQNALLELKKAAIESLDYNSFFSLFGKGRAADAKQMYYDTLRNRLSPPAQAYWDRHLAFFRGKGWRKSFYYRGTSGLLARLVLANAHLLHRLRAPINELLEADTVEDQRFIYETKIRDRIWTPWLRWFLSRSLTLSLAGVPWPQRRQITTQYPGGVAQFIRDAVETVVTRLPFSDNYFWRVYFQGFYTRSCCPEYLKPESFERLRGLLPRLKIHTATVTSFLRQSEPGISKFVLLDHMDWMSFHNPDGLVEEWEQILAKARPGARVIYRSAGLEVTYLDHLKVRYQRRTTELGPLLQHYPKLAAELHARDRVHTYGSFYIADLPMDLENG
jgi:S-adenosylmethionine-diacylglycerol 3-amino-3-carboxypropyl transferase